MTLRERIDGLEKEAEDGRFCANDILVLCGLAREALAAREHERGMFIPDDYGELRHKELLKLRAENEARERALEGE